MLCTNVLKAVHAVDLQRKRQRASSISEQPPHLGHEKKINSLKLESGFYRLLRGGVRATRESPNNLALGAFGRALDLAPMPLIWVGGAPRRSQEAVLCSG